MSNHPVPRPDHTPSQFLGAEEIEAIKYARRGIIPAMKHLVKLTQHSNASQARQAIELLLKYGMADRQQQFDMVTHESLGDGENPTVNLTLNKVELRLAEVMENMPPHLVAKAAAFIEEIESYAAEINLNIIDGEVIEEMDIELGPKCECGCGQHTNKYTVTNKARGIKKGEWARFVHGHHFRSHMTHERIPPKEISRLKAAGQWPPKDDKGNSTYGVDKKKAARAKKEAIKARKAQKRIEDV